MVYRPNHPIHLLALPTHKPTGVNMYATSGPTLFVVMILNELVIDDLLNWGLLEL